MGVQAYVLARKGVLVSNPDVSNMTWTQWLFEFNALKQREESLFKTSVIALRKTLITTLGLNLLRPVDEESGIPKKYMQMTEDEKEMYMPLTMWCGHPHILKDVADQVKLEVDMESAANPDSDYEKTVAAIDAADGDMEPIIGIPIIGGKVKDPRILHQEKLLVQPIVDVEGKV